MGENLSDKRERRVAMCKRAETCVGETIVDHRQEHFAVVSVVAYWVGASVDVEGANLFRDTGGNCGYELLKLRVAGAFQPR